MHRTRRQVPRASPASLKHEYLIQIVYKTIPALRSAGIEPDPALLARVAQYITLLLRWNAKVNLTAITDPEDIVRRHFEESFFASPWLGEGPGLLCDVGSGAGFPGLALKLVRPNWRMRLYEPVAKKAAFLKEVARSLELHDVEVCRERWQEARLDAKSVDAVTARALGRYSELVTWAARVLKPSGKLLLWVGAAEAAALRGKSGWRWESHELPGTRESVLLVGGQLQAD
jgi:16S rRNA (guanine527-N7)-methyltransferase